MKATSSELREHAQRFIRATVAEQLREQGFISKGNDDINWYRVVNGDVIQVIYFFTQHPYLPMTLQIGYGCHPLFITPLFPTGAHLQCMPGNEVLYPRYILMGQQNNFCYSKDILVTSPEDSSLIMDLLNQIFSALDSVTSPLACFQTHKHWRQKEIENNSWIHVSTHFVDEVIFWEDQDLYPFCKRYIFAREKLLQDALLKQPASKKFADELRYLQLLKQAIIDGKRDEHILRLSERTERTIRLLEKHVGIHI